jgi:hypothetical protein
MRLICVIVYISLHTSLSAQILIAIDPITGDKKTNYYLLKSELLKRSSISDSIFEFSYFELDELNYISCCEYGLNRMPNLDSITRSHWENELIPKYVNSHLLISRFFEKQFDTIKYSGSKNSFKLKYKRRKYKVSIFFLEEIDFCECNEVRPVQGVTRNVIYAPKSTGILSPIGAKEFDFIQVNFRYIFTELDNLIINSFEQR